MCLRGKQAGLCRGSGPLVRAERVCDRDISPASCGFDSRARVSRSAGWEPCEATSPIHRGTRVDTDLQARSVRRAPAGALT